MCGNACKRLHYEHENHFYLVHVSLYSYQVTILDLWLGDRTTALTLMSIYWPKCDNCVKSGLGYLGNITQLRQPSFMLHIYLIYCQSNFFLFLFFFGLNLKKNPNLSMDDGQIPTNTRIYGLDETIVSHVLAVCHMTYCIFPNYASTNAITQWWIKGFISCIFKVLSISCSGYWCIKSSVYIRHERCAKKKGPCYSEGPLNHELSTVWLTLMKRIFFISVLFILCGPCIRFHPYCKFKIYES